MGPDTRAVRRELLRLFQFAQAVLQVAVCKEYAAEQMMRLRIGGIGGNGVPGHDTRFGQLVFLQIDRGKSSQGGSVVRRKVEFRAILAFGVGLPAFEAVQRSAKIM